QGWVFCGLTGESCSGKMGMLARWRMSLFDLDAFGPNGSVQVVVESPRGSGLKLKYDPGHAVFTLSRPLMSGLTYPYDWGFVPSTWGTRLVRRFYGDRYRPALVRGIADRKSLNKSLI